MKYIINFFKDIMRALIGEVTTSRLIKRGLTVGENFSRQQGCFIDPTHCWLIEIGNNVTFSLRVVVLAHDASTKSTLGYAKIGKVSICDNVFIGANTTILPNVTIGENSIIGAGSLVTMNIPPNTVAAGVPARIICSVDDFKNKHLAHMEESVIFDDSYTMRANINEEKKQEMKKVLSNGMGYVK